MRLYFKTKMKIETPVKNFGGGGSGYGVLGAAAVQNEMISILSSKCLEKFVLEIKSSDEYVYSIIVDETTDLSKIEQFSLSIVSVIIQVMVWCQDGKIPSIHKCQTNGWKEVKRVIDHNAALWWSRSKVPSSSPGSKI